MARGLGTKGRFAVAYLVLGALIGTGLGGFIVLLQRPGPQPPAPWSSWQPSAAAMSSRLQEIADHVGSRYKLASGDQLAAVRLGGPANSKGVRAIIVPTKANPKTLADFTVFDKSKSAVYWLCGGGLNCKVAGAASKARGTVVRREALELALYTFEYDHSIDNVLVFVPPGPAEKKLTSTVFFHRGDLSSRLNQPLRKTLPRVPPIPGQIATTEERTVNDLTGSAIYRYVGILPANGFGDVLVIQPANGPTF